MRHKLNGVEINLYVQQCIGDVNWAAGDLLKNRDIWESLGITEEPDPAPSLDNVKSDQVAIISAACAASIYAGFPSSALGDPHHYPAQDKDQSNLAGSVLASILPGVDPATWVTPFICSDAEGVWAYREHTAEQIQQVGVDAKAAILAALLKNATLAAAVMAAPDVDSVLAVTWDA